MKKLQIFCACLLSIIFTVAESSAEESDAHVLQKGFDGLKIKKGEWNLSPDGILTNENGGIALIGSQKWENYTFEVTCKLSEIRIPYPFPGIFVRYSNSDNYISLAISPVEKRWYIEENQNGKLNRTNARFLPMKIGTEHKFRIVCNDNEIIIYLDEKEAGRVETSGDNYQGKVGFFGDKLTKTVFSNPVVTAGSEVVDEENMKAAIDFNMKLSTDSDNAVKHEDWKLVTCEKELNVPATNYVSVIAKGNGKEHVLGIVLTDNSGENHFIGKRKIRGSEWKTFQIRLDAFLESPVAGVFTGKSWGGDGNQKIDFPIKKAQIALYDKIENSDENNNVDIGQIKFYLKNPEKK